MKNEKFEVDIAEVPNHYRDLSITIVDEEKFIKGRLELVDFNGKVWGAFNVEIRGSEEYPFRFPLLFETDNAFPKIAAWHVYEDTQACCVDVTPNEVILCKDGLHVLEFIKKFAIPYLANQKYREQEGYYMYGEYSHGIGGRIEYYQSKLKARSIHQLLAMFDLILKGYNPNRRAYCPFCHKTKFRKCHRDVFREFSFIKGFIKTDKEAIQDFLEKKKGNSAA